MADGYERSRSYSSGSITDAFQESPSNYVQTRVNYEDEGYLRAFKDVAKLALPITITSLFVSALLFCNLVWIGHHATKNQYAGAALGNMLVNVMGNSILIGMTTGLDTQCGQAFGAEIYKMVGVFTQRSVLISHFVIVLIGFIFWWGDDILVGLGQDKDASREAGTFVRIFIASLWPIAMFANLRRFLQSQRKVFAIPIAVFIGLCAQIIALIILDNVLHLKFEGACIALPMSYWCMFATLFTITKWKGLHKECWPGWGKWAFQDWYVFLKLTVPGTVMLCAEWWAFEVLALVAGTMESDKATKADYVAAFTTCLNVLGIFIRIPLGISFGCAVLVSNKLGAKLGNSARMVFNAAIFLSISTCSVCAVIIFMFPDAFASIYTHDESIRGVVKETLPYMAVYFAIDSFQRCCAGGTRGMGRQLWGAAIYAVSYYCIGMPLGIWFGKEGFFGRGEPMYLKGLWVGAGISVTVCSFFFICLRLCVNWDREVARAQKRLEREQIAIENFKAEIADRMDADTMNKILREPHPSVNEGHYIKYSAGGHQHIHITEDSVSSKKFENMDDIEYNYDDDEAFADDVDATVNHTLDSYAMHQGSLGNSMQKNSPLSSQNNISNTNINSNYNNGSMVTPKGSINDSSITQQVTSTSMGSLPSISQIPFKKSTSQPGYGYAVTSQESNDMSTKRISVNVVKDSIDEPLLNENNANIRMEGETDLRKDENMVAPPSKYDTDMNGSLPNGHHINETSNNENNTEIDNENENENENENGNENENETENFQNGTMNGSLHNKNSNQNGKKGSLAKTSLKKKKKRRKNKNKNKTDALGHPDAKQRQKNRTSSQAEDRMD